MSCQLCNMKVQTIQKISCYFRRKILNFLKINTLGACFNSSGTLILVLFKGLLSSTVYLHTQFWYITSNYPILQYYYQIVQNGKNESFVISWKYDIFRFIYMCTNMFLRWKGSCHSCHTCRDLAGYGRKAGV